MWGVGRLQLFASYLFDPFLRFVVLVAEPGFGSVRFLVVAGQRPRFLVHAIRGPWRVLPMSLLCVPVSSPVWVAIFFARGWPEQWLSGLCPFSIIFLGLGGH
jgi:hypothetical protein